MLCYAMGNPLHFSADALTVLRSVFKLVINIFLRLKSGSLGILWVCLNIRGKPVFPERAKQKGKVGLVETGPAGLTV